MDSEGVESHWEKLKVSYIETCQTVLGTKKRQHKEWMTGSVDGITRHEVGKVNVLYTLAIFGINKGSS